MSTHKALSRAIEIAGSQKALADLIPIDPRTLWAWSSRGNVPVEHCPAIERAVKGAVSCEELRGDATWLRIPDADWPHAGGRPLVDHSAKKAA